MVRNKLVEQVQLYSSLDGSLAESAIHSGDIKDIQALGFDSAIRMATVRGIELFTDTDYLASELFKEKPEADNV